MAQCYRRMSRKYYIDAMALCKKILVSFKDNIATLEVRLNEVNMFLAVG